MRKSYRDVFDNLIAQADWTQLDLFDFTIRNKFVRKVDNGYILDFHYRSGDKVIKTTRVYATDGEVEVAVQELEMEFDNLLRKK